MRQSYTKVLELSPWQTILGPSFAEARHHEPYPSHRWKKMSNSQSLIVRQASWPSGRETVFSHSAASNIQHPWFSCST